MSILRKFESGKLFNGHRILVSMDEGNFFVYMDSILISVQFFFVHLLDFLDRISRTERSGRYGSDQSRGESEWRERRGRDQDREPDRDHDMRRWGEDRRGDRYEGDRRGNRDQSPEVEAHSRHWFSLHCRGWIFLKCTHT